MRMFSRIPRGALLLRFLRRFTDTDTDAQPGVELERHGTLREAEVPEREPYVSDPTAWVRTVTDPRDLFLA